VRGEAFPTSGALGTDVTDGVKTDLITFGFFHNVIDLFLAAEEEIGVVSSAPHRRMDL